ncbi:hypothetical protein ZIOFF_043002 [Zingiber officinale]|uniref:Uncharacterized protein n=1 Tax=Zingiber officinale TaxID=94328 RepID=A0A8J5FZN4_ZINOF|nr:hypothetical protein ZIOFF_043002 [Zingiber officinale]
MIVTRAPPAAVLLSASLTNTKLSGLSGGPILFYFSPCVSALDAAGIITSDHSTCNFGRLESPPSLSLAATSSSSICHRRRAEYTGESIAVVTPFVLGFVPLSCIAVYDNAAIKLRGSKATTNFPYNQVSLASIDRINSSPARDNSSSDNPFSSPTSVLHYSSDPMPFDFGNVDAFALIVDPPLHFPELYLPGGE